MEGSTDLANHRVRDAAYDGLPAAVRAVHHERFARWLLREHPGPAYEGIVGSHLESAYRCRVATGWLDAAAAALGVEAADRLAGAGRQLAKVDDPASIDLFRRAVGVAGEGRHRRALELELAFRLFDSGLGQAEALALADKVSARGEIEVDVAVSSRSTSCADTSTWRPVMATSISSSVPQRLWPTPRSRGAWRSCWCGKRGPMSPTSVVTSMAYGLPISQRPRDTWRRAAGTVGTPVHIVLLRLADAAEHRRRLGGRERRMVNVGEPTWEQVEARATAYEPWAGPFTDIDASRSLDEVVDEVLAVLD